MPKNWRGPGYQIIVDLIEKFPDAPARTLARMAFRKHPTIWSSVESCRRAVREHLGLCGKKSRQETKDKSHFRAPRKAGEIWDDVIPEPVVQMKDWAALQIDGPAKGAILNDAHIPFHDPDALEVALDYIHERKPTHIILNGDTMDHFDISDFTDRNPACRDFPQEVDDGTKFFAGLRRTFPKTRIILKHGNHEERYERFMRKKCPEFLDIEKFSWESVFELEKHKIELVKQKRPIRFGKLTIFHGHEFGKSFSNPVGAARWLYLKTGGVNAMCGHLHVSDHFSKKNANDSVIGTWAVGCLCELRPEYRPINEWVQGFAFVEIDSKGNFRVDNLKIKDGKVM